jgi:hypothetical protein
MSRLLLVSALSLTLVGLAPTASASPAGRSFPTTGVLTPGVSLGGLQIGYTNDQVVKHWRSRRLALPSVTSAG